MCPLGSGIIDRVVGPHVPGVTAFFGVDYQKEVKDVSTGSTCVGNLYVTAMVNMCVTSRCFAK